MCDPVTQVPWLNFSAQCSYLRVSWCVRFSSTPTGGAFTVCPLEPSVARDVFCVRCVLLHNSPVLAWINDPVAIYFSHLVRIVLFLQCLHVGLIVRCLAARLICATWFDSNAYIVDSVSVASRMSNMYVLLEQIQWCMHAVFWSLKNIVEPGATCECELVGETRVARRHVYRKIVRASRWRKCCRCFPCCALLFLAIWAFMLSHRRASWMVLLILVSLSP